MEEQRRINLEKLVGWKLNSELKLFRSKMLSSSKEEIYQASYEIDIKIQLYEALVELIPSLSNQILQRFIGKSNLLDFLFRVWMQTPDSQTEELNHMIWKSINRIEENIA